MKRKSIVIFLATLLVSNGQSLVHVETLIEINNYAVVRHDGL